LDAPICDDDDQHGASSARRALDHMARVTPERGDSGVAASFQDARAR
jgi:hypothetical protein